MKKLWLIPALAVVCISTTCKSNNDDGKSEKARRNLEVSHIISKAFETGDKTAIDDAVASDFVDHTERGNMGRDSLKAMITMVHATMKDMKMEVIKEIADDEYVFSLMHFSGISDGAMGMPKGPYDMQAIELMRCKDGKAAEHWEFMQLADMMKMMGTPPATKMMNEEKKPVKDSTSK